MLESEAKIVNEEVNIADLKVIYDRKRKEGGVVKPHLKMLDFLKRLNIATEELKKYELYHILIGSTPSDPAKLEGVDLPDGAIERFIREEL